MISAANQADVAKRSPPSVAECRVVALTNIVSPYAKPVYEGIARRVAKFTVLVATAMEKDRQWQASFGTLDVRVQRSLAVPERVRGTGFTQAREIFFPWDTLRQLKELRPDVIVSRACGFQSIGAALYRAMHPETSLIIWNQCSEYTERNIRASRRWIRRWLFQRADAMLANGESCRRYLERLGYPGERIFHGPYVALPETYSGVPAQRTGADSHRLLCIGQLIERKGLLPMFAALRRWAERDSNRDIELVMVGSGPQEAELRSLSLPTNVRVTWAGYRTYDQIAAEYARAGLLIFPTYEDEWGLVVNEALAAGLPVIGSRYSQAVEQHCRDGETGWTFRPDHDAEFDAALASAFNASETRLNEMRSACREEVRHVTTEYVVQNVARAIEAALSRRQP